MDNINVSNSISLGHNSLHSTDQNSLMVSVYYPNWSKKALTFTLDDAKAEHDEALISILRESNMKATFNIITSTVDLSDSIAVRVMRNRYRGFDVANHSKYHPYPYERYETEGAYTEYTGYDEDNNTIQLYKRMNGGIVALEEDYIRCVYAGHVELERIFGKGSDTGFVWPGPGAGNYSSLICYVDSFYENAMIRGGEANLSDTSFTVPGNWLRWNYNANHSNIYVRAQEFNKLALNEDDTLRWLCVGAHAQDYIEKNKIDDFKSAVNLLKQRPDEFWYATNREICNYITALKALTIEEKKIKNMSNCTLFIKIKGSKVIIPAQNHISIEKQKIFYFK